MNIGIDARLYGTGHGGIGRYTQKLIEELEKIDHKNQYMVFLQKSNFDEFQPVNKNFKKVLADYRAYSWQEQILFCHSLNRYHFDFTHFTHFNAPIFYCGRYIVTIHDLIISRYPDSRATTLNPFLYRLKLWFYRFFVKKIAQKAEKIIAVSQFTKNDIVNFLRADPLKIEVIYEGAPVPQSRGLATGQAENNYGRYLLYVGSAYPHKNLEKLLIAFKIVKEKFADLKLVLVGKDGFFYQRLKTEIEKSGLISSVILTGYVNDDKLDELYQNAELYIFPSLIEGFGLPPLEAQAQDLAVVSSNATCLPEILGESALYFNPENTDEMAEKIILALSDKKLRQELIEKGRKNIKKYSWEKCGQETAVIYKKFLV